MSKQKILTICIPTYNRDKHLDEQLKRLTMIPSAMWKDISLIISDNCSTDNTEHIVKKYLDIHRVDIEYSKNETNLGMDGNFVKCFRAAKSKYVWLLGDDDYILIDRLPDVIKVLEKSECGVCHLSVSNIKDNGHSIYDGDAESFLKDIGIYITYISSNIVNTKYVRQIEFEKYYGTFFTLIPLYLTSILNEKYNVMINGRVFEDGKDVARNGGYNFIQVFVDNYLKIFKEFFDLGRISNVLYDYEKNIAMEMAVPYLVRYVIFKKKSNYKTENSWKIMFRHYGRRKVIMQVIISSFCFMIKRIKLM